jgi:uncharacterized lipoprotein YddW (UPF0748 family)
MSRLGSVLLAFSMALAFLTTGAHAQAPPKHEFRGAWIATAYNLDWPPSPTASPSTQKADLRRMLDSLKAVGINAVVFQVRSEGDAMYASDREPWAYELTGEQGRAPDPFYDPLQFVLDEAHTRGMEVHAWSNPFRAVSDGSSYERDSTHVAVEHPEWLLEFEGGLTVLDPGLPEVRDYVTQVVLDVVRRYDVDGVHFDDYFYPYPPNEMDQEGNRTKDRDTFEKHPRGFDDIEDWRRDNINTFMAQVHDSIQAEKPHVTFGVSPFGIWKAGVPNGIAGLSAYHTIYADAVAWLRDESIDYLAPQFYWGFGGGQNYATLAPWWAAEADGNGRHLYPGLAAYKAATGSASALQSFQVRATARYGARDFGPGVVPRQVRFNRRRGSIQGSIFFRTEHLTRTPAQGLPDSLRRGLYRRPALPPSLPWEATDPPAPPQDLTVDRTGPEDKGVTLQWDASGSDPSGAERYAVYRVQADALPDFATETRTAEHLLAVTGTPMVRDRPVRAEAPYHYAVTAVGPNAGESPPSGSVTAGGRVSQAAEAFAVRGPNPNPFTGAARLVLDLAAAADVTVTVYDVLGRHVQQVRTSMPPGPGQTVRVDGSAFASGVYFYRVRVTTDDDSRTIGSGRMVKVRE